MSFGSEDTPAKRDGSAQGNRSEQPWFRKLSSPILFLLVSLALVGIYLAVKIPVAVFPNTDFPRIVIGVDNGVAPIDQMLVTVTKPIEEAVNSVPGLTKVQSITSRGSAEVDLFFDWGSDMILTLQRVDAVVARLQPELPPGAKIETHRLTFATFPILGYSLTSDAIPQSKLWEIATYDLKPRINRLDGVASVLVQGGRVPEFQVTPDPARLQAAGITVTDILDAIRRTRYGLGVSVTWWLDWRFIVKAPTAATHVGPSKWSYITITERNCWPRPRAGLLSQIVHRLGAR